MLERGASVEQITWYIASIQTDTQAVDAMTRLANFPTSLFGMPFDPSLLGEPSASGNAGAEQAPVPLVSVPGTPVGLN
eukprot:4427097-Prymnesium_polylepis.1